MQLFGVSHGLDAGAHVGLGDDFQQRRAGAVQVDAGLANEVFVQRLAGVFFQMRAHQAHGLFLGQAGDFGHEEFDRTALHDRNLILANLVAFGQVGVKIVFARKNALGRDVRANSQAEFDGALHCALVHDRQRARQGQVYGAGLGIGLVTERGAGAAENLARGR